MIIAIAIVSSLIASQVVPRLVRMLLDRTRRLPRLRNAIAVMWPPMWRRSAAPVPPPTLALPADLQKPPQTASWPAGAGEKGDVARMSAQEKSEFVAWAGQPTNVEAGGSGHDRSPGQLHRGLVSVPAGDALALPAGLGGLPDQGLPPAVLRALPPRGDQLPRARLVGVSTRSVDSLITDDSIIIGRDPLRVDVVVDDPSVNERHCQLLFRSGQWFAIDLASTAGTIVDGKSLSAYEPVPVRDNQIVRVGTVELRLSAPTATVTALSFDAAVGASTARRSAGVDHHLVLPQVLALSEPAAGEPSVEAAASSVIEVARSVPAGESLDALLARISARLPSWGVVVDEQLGSGKPSFDVVKLVSDSWGWRVTGAHVGSGAVYLGERGTFRRVTSGPARHRVIGSERELSSGKQGDAAARLAEAPRIGDRAATQRWSESVDAGHRILVATPALTAVLGSDRVLGLLTACQSMTSADAAGRLVSETRAAGFGGDVAVIVADVRRI